VLALRYTKSYRNWQGGASADAVDEGRKFGREFLASAGHAGDADAVDEARGELGDALDALVGAGGREEVYQVETAGTTGVAEGVGLLRREVDGDDAVGADAGGVAAKRFEAIGKEWIIVAHEYEWRYNALRSQFVDHVQADGGRDSLYQGMMRRALDGRTFRQRVGEGDTQLDDVSASLDKGGNQSQGVFDAAVTDGEEGDEPRAALGAEAGEGLVYSAQVATPETARPKLMPLNSR
jgi:hypothetical protein